MARLFLQWFLSAGALLLVANLFSGVQVHSLSSALWAALILGLLNAVLRPVLVVLTLPVTLVTLGLFRPFAVVSEYRMKLESVTLHIKGGVDQVAGTLARQQTGGIGDALADAAGLELIV